MMRQYSILLISITFAISGCTAWPFFSSEETVPNPVPKPDWEQARSAPDSKLDDAGREPKRTPSLVWLPEHRINVNALAMREQRVIDRTGNPISTGFSDCLSTGYSLLEGTDCGPQNDEINDMAAVDTQGALPTELGSDLLGSTNQYNESPAQVAENVATTANAKPAVTQSNASQSQVTKPIDERLPILHSSVQAHPIPATYERVTLSSDLFFPFAKSELDSVSEEGQRALSGLLDRFARYDKLSLRKVIITGHSDRLGKQSTKLALSEQRASSVKVFLIKAGIDADILETAGIGAASPVKHCAGKARSAELKACLAPNRRVEIEIIGAA